MALLRHGTFLPSRATCPILRGFATSEPSTIGAIRERWRVIGILDDRREKWERFCVWGQSDCPPQELISDGDR